MRASNTNELVRLDSAVPTARANVYDLGERQEESVRLRRIGVLEHENALLMRMVSETHVELTRLRQLLAET